MRNGIAKTVLIGVLLMDMALIAGVAYLAFIFPRTVALWAESAAEISTGQALLANASMVCSSYGWVLLPVLLLASAFTVFALMVVNRRHQ